MSDRQHLAITSAFDPGRVNTPKGRSRRGFVFSKASPIRGGLANAPQKIGAPEKIVLCALRALTF